MVALKALLIDALTASLPQQEVLGEIECSERRPAGVQRLEDDLFIIVFVELDRRDLDMPSECIVQRERSLLLGFGLFVKLFARTIGEP